MSLDRVGELLAPYLEKLGMNAPDAAARLHSEWEDIAGDPWATASRPAGLSHGELTLDIVDAATLSVLRYRTGELLERLTARLGQDTVTGVRLRVSRRPF